MKIIKYIKTDPERDIKALKGAAEKMEAVKNHNDDPARADRKLLCRY